MHTYKIKIYINTLKTKKKNVKRTNIKNGNESKTKRFSEQKMRQCRAKN